MIKKIMKGLRHMKREVIRDSVEMFEAKGRVFKEVSRDIYQLQLVSDICVGTGVSVIGIGAGIILLGLLINKRI